MLSDHNIEKLNKNGLYTCEPDVKYRGRLHESNLYHCCNWTFEVVKNHEGKYCMRDTYWSSGDSVGIHLTDENIDEFTLLFEKDKVKSIQASDAKHYDKHYRVGIDSGGWSYPKYFVDINAKKSKKLILDEIDKEIEHAKWKLEHLQQKKEGIESGDYNLEWV